MTTCPASGGPARSGEAVEVGRSDQTQRVSQVVEHLDGGGGVVDGGRQRADRDVDHDPDREGGILLDRPLDSERDHAVELAIRRRRSFRESRSVPRPRVRSRRPRGAAREDSCAGGRNGPDRVRRTPGSCRRARLRTTSRSVAPARGRASRADQVQSDSDDGLNGLAEGLAAGPRDQRRHRDWSQPVQDAVEEEHEHQDAREDQEPRGSHPDVRHGRRFDAAKKRERERQGAQEGREHRLQHAVAVPEPHVTGRERPRRHLHDEHA